MDKLLQLIEEGLLSGEGYAETYFNVLNSTPGKVDQDIENAKVALTDLRQLVQSNLTQAFDTTIDAVLGLHIKATEKLVASVEQIITAFRAQGWNDEASSRHTSAVVKQAFINLEQRK